MGIVHYLVLKSSEVDDVMGAALSRFDIHL